MPHLRPMVRTEQDTARVRLTLYNDGCSWTQNPCSGKDESYLLGLNPGLSLGALNPVGSRNDQAICISPWKLSKQRLL